MKNLIYKSMLAIVLFVYCFTSSGEANAPNNAATFIVSFEPVKGSSLPYNDLPEEEAGSFNANPFFKVVQHTKACHGTYSAHTNQNRTVIDWKPSITKRSRYSMGKCKNVGETYTFSGSFTWAAASSRKALEDVRLRLIIATKKNKIRISKFFYFNHLAQNQYSDHSVTYTTNKNDIGEDIEFWIEWIDDDKAAGNVYIRADKLVFAAKGKKPTWGVIRWDGYNGSPYHTQIQEIGYNSPADNEKKAVEFIEPTKYNWRAPFYANLDPKNNPDRPLRLNDAFNQDFIDDFVDKEIDYAKYAGIDYWAICHYAKHKTFQLRNALESILRNPKKDVKFSLIAIAPHIKMNMKSETVFIEWTKYVDEYIDLMKESNYQKVLNSRPIFFIFNPEKLSIDLGDSASGVSDCAQLANAIKYFREKAISAGLKNPYIVCMSAGGLWVQKYVINAGADAASVYRGGFGASPEGTGFYKLWGKMLSMFLKDPSIGGLQGCKVIPNMPCGLNNKPRIDAAERAGQQNYDKNYYHLPLNNEGYNLWKNTMDYVSLNPNNKFEANTIITYAWNEFSEGGFLCPLVGNDPYEYYDYNTGQYNADAKPNAYYLEKYKTAIYSWIPPYLNKNYLVCHLPFQGYFNNAQYPAHFTKATDVSGHNNNGWGSYEVINKGIIGENMIDYSTGEISTVHDYSIAASFNGETDEIVIPDHPSLDGMPEITISFWLCLDQLPSEESRKVFAPLSKEGSYRFIIDAQGGGHFVVATNQNNWYSNGTIASFSAQTIKKGKWYHVVGTYDGNKVRIWINGEASGEGKTAISGKIIDNPRPLKIAACGSNVRITNMPGKIDDIKIYKKACYWGKKQ